MSKRVLFVFVAAAATTAQAQYYTIGQFVSPFSVTNDGVVAGYDGEQYFMWSPESGYSGIGGARPGDGHGGIPSISRNGGRIGGTSMNAATGKSEMSYYDVESNTWTQLGSFGSSSGDSASAGFAMSADGQIVVGNAWIDAGHAHAAIWRNGIFSDLGSSIAGASSRADGVSEDGSLIGGYQDRADGYRSGAVWVNGTQILLENNGEPLADVHAVSGNGQWAVGRGGYALEGRAFMWSPTSGLTALDNPFAGENREMFATAINYDGTVMVGVAREAFGWDMDKGWIWTAAGGTMTTEAYAISLGVYNGDYLSNPLGISADGRTIVGEGLNASGSSFIGWSLTTPVPEPSTMLALGAGLLVLLKRGRKRTS